MSNIVLFPTEAIKCSRGRDFPVSLITVQSVYLLLAMFLSLSALALTPVAAEERMTSRTGSSSHWKTRAKMAEGCFLSFDIYIFLLYASSIVCNVRIQ